MTPVESLRAGEVGYLITGIKDVSLLRVGDTLTTKDSAAARAAARLPRGQADGVLRPLPGGDRPVPGAARRAREAGPERRRPVVGARDQPGARVRLPLRLPRPAPHGHRARAPRARVRPRRCSPPRRTSSTRSRSPTAARSSCTRPPTCRTASCIEEIREPYIRATILTPREHVGAVMELCQERRGVHVDMALPLRGARADPLRPAARRDRARLLRPAEVAHQGLRVARLRAARDAPGRPREAGHPAGRRQRGRALDGRAQGQGLRGRPGADRAPPQADPAPAVRGGDPGGGRRRRSSPASR